MRFFIIDNTSEITIRLGYGVELVAALDSFISEGKSPLNIQPIKKTPVKVISKVEFLKLFSNSEDLQRCW